MATNIWFWVLFNVFVLALLALDLGVFHRKDHEEESFTWTTGEDEFTSSMQRGFVRT